RSLWRVARRHRWVARANVVSPRAIPTTRRPLNVFNVPKSRGTDADASPIGAQSSSSARNVRIRHRAELELRAPDGRGHRRWAGAAEAAARNTYQATATGFAKILESAAELPGAAHGACHP